MLNPDEPHWRFHKAAGELYGPPQPDSLAYLLDCIEQDRPPLANIAAARDALAVTLAAYESARTGQPVRLA